jgi:rhodanese-related sulfurtransferase
VSVPTEIDREEVRRLVEQGAQLVEVLPADEYEAPSHPGVSGKDV